MVFDLRVRLYSDALVKGRVLPTASLQCSIQSSDTAMVTFSMVGVHDVLPADGRFIVGVEYSTGGAYAQPRNGLFIVSEDEGDEADPSGVRKYSGRAFIPYLLEGMHQRANAYTGAYRKSGKSIWPDATPGRIMRSLIDHGQEIDGWAPMLTVDFTPTTDSAGVAWTTADRWSPEFEDLTPIGDILDSLVTNALVDWWAEGAKLRMFRAGTGAERSVKLGGVGFTRVPVKGTWEDQFTYLTAVDEDGVKHYYSNPGADAAYGRYHQVVTMSGVKGADVDRLVVPVLEQGRTPQREMSYEWTVSEDEQVQPWRDFQVGDMVQALGRGGWVSQRVLGITVSKSGSEPVTIRATVGNKLVNRLKRAVTAVNRGTGGSGTKLGGTGKPVPVKQAPKLPLPKAPTGLFIGANTAHWGRDGKAITQVSIGWDEVTQSMDSADVDVDGYEVWSREGTQAPHRDTFTALTSYMAEGWRPEVPRFVKVCAVDEQGRRGAFSDEIMVTPVMPPSIIPKAPTGLHVTSNVGRFNEDNTAVSDVHMAWTPVVASTDEQPVEVREYVALIGHSTDGDTITSTDVVRVTDPELSFSIPAGSGVFVTVAATSTLGITGDPSTRVYAAAALPLLTLVAPSGPVLTTGLGAVHARWDGGWAGGLPVPAGAAYVITETAPAAAGPWTVAGVPLAEAGGNMLPAVDTGETVYVRFYAKDALGRVGPYSVVSQITVTGLDVGLIPGLEGALDAVRFTADGKNRIFVSQGEPAGDGSNLWPNPRMLPSGTLPVSSTHGSSGAVTTVSGLPDPGDGVTTAIQSESRGDIATWMRLVSLSSARIPVQAGRTYTFRSRIRISIPGTAAVARNVIAAVAWKRADGSSIRDVSGGNIPVTTGVDGGFSPWTDMVTTVVAPEDAAGVDFFTGITNGAPTGTVIQTTAWQFYEGEAREGFQESHKQGDLWFQLDAAEESVTHINVWDGASWVPQILYAENIVAAESITGQLVRAGTLEVNNVSPTFGDDLNLSANEAVTIIVGRQEDQDATVSNLTETVDGVSLAVDDAAATAQDALSAAGAAADAADAAQGSADDVSTRLDVHQTYYRFGDDGLSIGDPDSAAELRLTPERIEMTQNDVVVSYWEGGVFVADEARLQSVQVGNHQFTDYGAGRTIVRPL